MLGSQPLLVNYPSNKGRKYSKSNRYSDLMCDNPLLELCNVFTIKKREEVPLYK